MVMVAALSSLVAPGVVVMTAFGAVGNGGADVETALGFQYLCLWCIVCIYTPSVNDWGTYHK